MKNLFLILVFLPFVSFAKEECADTPYQYKKVVTVDNAPKTELYNRCKASIAQIFKSAMDVIQVDDKENGKVILKGCVYYPGRALNPGTKAEGDFWFTFSFECKDGRYRVIISDVYHEAYDKVYDGGRMSFGTIDCGRGYRNKHIRNSAIEDIEKLGAQFESEMQKPYKSTDW